MPPSTSEILSMYAVRCCNCGKLATRVRDAREGYLEVTVRCGPFRTVTEMVKTDRLPVDYSDEEFQQIQGNSNFMMDALASSEELKEFMTETVVTETPLEAKDYAIPIGPCFCDRCGPPGQHFVDLPHAKLVRKYWFRELFKKRMQGADPIPTRFERINREED